LIEILAHNDIKISGNPPNRPNQTANRAPTQNIITNPTKIFINPKLLILAYKRKKN